MLFLWLLQIQPLPITLPQELPTLPVALSKQKSQSPLLQLFQTERWGGKRCSVAGKSESQSRRVAGRRQAGKWGRRLALVGRASEFRPPSLWGSFQPFWGKKGCAGYRHHGEREGRTTLGTPTAARFECRGGSGVRMEFRLEKLVEKRKRILI